MDSARVVCADDGVHRQHAEGWRRAGRLHAPDMGAMRAIGPPRRTAAGLCVPVVPADAERGGMLLDWRPGGPAGTRPLALPQPDAAPLQLRWRGEALVGVVETAAPGNTLCAWDAADGLRWQRPAADLPGLEWVDGVHPMPGGDLLVRGTTAARGLLLLRAHWPAGAPHPQSISAVPALTRAVAAALSGDGEQVGVQLLCPAPDRVVAAASSGGTRARIVALGRDGAGGWATRWSLAVDGVVEGLHADGPGALASIRRDDHACLCVVGPTGARTLLRLPHTDRITELHVLAGDSLPA